MWGTGKESGPRHPWSRPRDAPRVLVVEDDPVLRTILSRYLSQRGCCVLSASSAAEALEIFAHTPIDVTVSDVRMPGMSGHELLQEVRRRDSEADLILITAHSSVKDAVAAIQAGAADYLEKPVDCRRLHHTIQMIAERRRLRQRVRILELGGRDSTVFEGMVARSRRMLEVFSFIERIAEYPTTTLIMGESGTGKELVARAVHQRSPLRDRPFVICNCSVLAPGLIESELFGHVRGAFTGADRDRKGLFETASGGTIFLDEIGELPLGAQVKLLRVLENREIRRVGSPASIGGRDPRRRRDQPRPRTHGPPGRVPRGPVLPPERRRDRPAAAARAARGPRAAERALHDAVRAPLRARQGRHRAARDARDALATSGRATCASCATCSSARRSWRTAARSSRTTCRPTFAARPTSEPDDEISPLDLSLEAAERDQIRRALDSAGGRRVAAARLLGLSRRTLYRKLDKYGIR